MRRRCAELLSIVGIMLFFAACAKTDNPKNYEAIVEVIGRDGSVQGPCQGDEPSIQIDGIANVTDLYDASTKSWKITTSYSSKGQNIHVIQKRPCDYAFGDEWFPLREDPKPVFKLKLKPVEEHAISGIVKFKGKPIADAQVQAYRPWDNQSFTVPTDASGNFTMPFKVGFMQDVRVTTTYKNCAPYVLDMKGGDPTRKEPEIFNLQPKR